MRRRTVVRTLGAASGATVAGFAGCLTRDGDDGPPDDPDDGDPEPDDPDLDGTLRIATYQSMVTGLDPAGPWLAEAFTETYPDAELEWVIPESGMEHYLQRGAYGDEIDVDICLGFTVGDLARIDDRVGEGGLFRELNRDRIEGVERVRDGLEFEDPHDRAIAYDTGYVSLVYDSTVIHPPESFDDLLASEYEDTLLSQQPTTSLPGQAFLLWTFATEGPDHALAYWEELLTNGARIHESWSDAYVGNYLERERPVVVSYSTDPVFAAMEGYDADRHQVAFPNDEGYALSEAMGIFETAPEPDLAYAFLEFVLEPETQAELARRNVQFPAVADVDLERGFDALAREPPEPVATSYTELRGTLDGWLEDWNAQFGDAPIAEQDPDN